MSDVENYPWPMRLLSTPEARELGELNLMEADLQHVVHALKILIEQFGGRDNFNAGEEVIRLSLYRDAVLQIVSCFDGSGSAALYLKISEVYVGDPNAASYLESLRAIRGSFVAHRAGAARQGIVGLIASEEKVIGTASLSVRYHVPALTDLKHMHDFALKAGRHVIGRKTKLDEHVGEFVMAMPIEEAHKLPEAGIRAPLVEELHNSREAFATGRIRKNPKISVD